MTGKELKKELTKRVKKYGKKCPDFQWYCGVCAVYMALEILVDQLVFEDD